MLFEGLGTGGDVCFPEFLCFGCFSKGSSTTVPFCRYLGYESLSVLLLGERLWMVALGIEQNKAQSELQQAALEKQQHSVIQPLACALEHCVYICNLTYPLGSRRPPPPPLLPFFPFIPSHSHSFLLSIFSLSLCLLLTQSLTSSRHSLFLLHKDIVKQTHPHAFSHWHPYTQKTPRALKIRHVWDHSLNVSGPLQPARFFYWFLKWHKDFWCVLRAVSSLYVMLINILFKCKVRARKKKFFLAEIELELRVFKYTWRRGLHEYDPVLDGEQLWAVSCVCAFNCSVRGFHQPLPLSLRHSSLPPCSRLHFTNCNKASVRSLSIASAVFGAPLHCNPCKRTL